MQRKLLELEREPGEGAAEGASPGASLAGGLGGGGAAAGLEAALAQAPLTADSLANLALGEAAGVMAACRAKLAEAAAEAAAAAQQQEGDGEGGAPPEPPAGGPGPSSRGDGDDALCPAPRLALDWCAGGAQALASTIQACVWSMVLLQRGSDRGVPLELLSAALDTSLAHARPRHTSNQGLFEEVKEAMSALQAQLLATS